MKKKLSPPEISAKADEILSKKIKGMYLRDHESKRGDLINEPTIFLSTAFDCIKEALRVNNEIETDESSHSLIHGTPMTGDELKALDEYYRQSLKTESSREPKQVTLGEANRLLKGKHPDVYDNNEKPTTDKSSVVQSEPTVKESLSVQSVEEWLKENFIPNVYVDARQGRTKWKLSDLLHYFHNKQDRTNQPESKKLTLGEANRLLKGKHPDVYGNEEPEVIREDEIFTVLCELVDLKKYKDEYGKDEYYLETQPVLWEKANILLRKHLDKGWEELKDFNQVMTKPIDFTKPTEKKKLYYPSTPDKCGVTDCGGPHCEGCDDFKPHEENEPYYVNGRIIKKGDDYYFKWSEFHSFARGTEYIDTKIKNNDIKNHSVDEVVEGTIETIGYDEDNFSPINRAVLK